jgi:Fur family ferric uptake transcriptional regulator
MEQQQLEQVVADLRRRGGERGIRWTSQRQSVLTVFLSAGGHLTVEDLHALVAKDDPTISAATVYRTMNLLVEQGLAIKHHFRDQASAAFEPVFGRPSHDHMVCTDCGRIIEFADDIIEARQRQVAQDYGFELRARRQELRGRCESCRGLAGAD